MVKMTFVAHDGGRHEIEADAGLTIMEAAVAKNVAGLDASCGGACACATCHVILTPDWYGKLAAPEDTEVSLLEFASDVTPTSRLSCQIEITEDMDGMELTLPEHQG